MTIHMEDTDHGFLCGTVGSLEMIIFNGRLECFKKGARLCHCHDLIVDS